MIPKKWSLKVTDENREIVDNWRINIIKYSNGSIGKFIYITENGSGRGFTKEYILPDKYNEITTEQFIKYVLNGEIDPENYTYLINLLTKLNIE